MIGPQETKVVIQPLQGLLRLVHQVLVTYPGVPFLGQTLLQFHVILHPLALEGGVLEKAAPDAWPPGDGGDHGPRVPHQVHHLDVCVIHPRLQACTPQPGR